MYLLFGIIVTIAIVTDGGYGKKINAKYKKICSEKNYDLVENVWILNITKIIVYGGITLLWPIILIKKLFVE